ncbi:Imm21 family immunity protein [Streptomyces sp. NPDC021224]|uniref:Imm21 family immunity protein n=1 Tax=unclassified Streptomyces TaxID=2593676 RepID=UPI003799CBA4
MNLSWVESMGGPLIAIPASALAAWHGCTGDGIVLSDGDFPDDYDRACDVEDLAGVIEVGADGAQALVLADEPATSCFLAEHRVFLRWLGADSEADLVAAVKAVLADATAPWEECGTWATDGPAVLMDSAVAGADLNVEYPAGGRPEQAPVPLPAGVWTIRAAHTRMDGRTSVGLVQILPVDA